MIAYVDCSAGISPVGLLAALVDGGFALETVRQTVAAVELLAVQIEGEQVTIQGLPAYRLTVRDNDVLSSHSSHSLAVWRTALEASTLARPVLTTVVTCLTRLLEARQALSHPSVPVLEVPGREIAALVGVAAALDALGIQQLYTSALPLTSGSVQTVNGVHTIPDPVTVEILRRARACWIGSSLTGELVSPLGAALLATLARFDLPPFIMERVSYGVDTAFPMEAPLRLCFGESQSTTADGADIDWVAVIESHLDTMTGELLGGLMERLFTAGALDVTYTPIQMKKNRPATLLTVICPLALGEPLSLLLLRETTTLGIRIQHIRRLKAQREQSSIETVLGTIQVKVKRLGTQIISVAPEYEACQRIASARDIPLADVYEVARAAIHTLYHT